jgi:hypothetical protein
VGAALLLVLDVSSWHSIILQKEDYSSLREVCDYAENTGAGRVYFLNDSSLAEICRLLDHEGILYLGADEETGTTLTYDYYLKYADIPVEPEGALLVIENLYGEQPQEELTLFGAEYTYRETIGEFVIYQSGKL